MNFVQMSKSLSAFMENNAGLIFGDHWIHDLKTIFIHMSTTNFLILMVVVKGKYFLNYYMIIINAVQFQLDISFHFNINNKS